MRRTVLLLVVLVVGISLLGPGMAAASPEAAGQGDDPLPVEVRAWVEANEPIRVGWTTSQRPVAVVEDDDVSGGYNVDAWSLAAARLDVDIEHVAYPDAEALGAALNGGDVDIVGGLRPIPSITATSVPVAEPWARIPLVFVGRQDQAEQGVEDLSGRLVSGRSSLANRDLILAEHPGGEYVPTDGPREGLRAVADGELDLYYGPLALLGYQINQLELDLVPVGRTSITASLRSWAPANSPAAQLQDAARSSLTDSDLALLHVLWTGFDMTEPDTGLPEWLLPLALALAGALLVALLFVVLLRQRVRAATAEIRAVNEGLEATVAERTEELAKSATRLRRSNKALQRFASTAAHDLKGPLVAIAGLSDVVRTMDLPERQADDLLRRIAQSSRRLERMVEDMLDDAVSLGATAGPIRGPDFEAWLREVTAPELSVIDARLDVEVPLRQLDTDVEVLRRAALNLVTNATKYATNEDGTVIRVELRRVDDTWELVVDDNGPGIPDGMWGEIFETGTRLTYDDRGFGLGLAAIRDLVQGAGGAIRVGDADLGGARFVVTLPLQATPGGDAGRGPSGQSAAVGPDGG